MICCKKKEAKCRRWAWLSKWLQETMNSGNQCDKTFCLICKVAVIWWHGRRKKNLSILPQVKSIREMYWLCIIKLGAPSKTQSWHPETEWIFFSKDKGNNNGFNISKVSERGQEWETSVEKLIWQLLGEGWMGWRLLLNSLKYFAISACLPGEFTFVKWGECY